MKSNTFHVRNAVTSSRNNYLTILEDAWSKHLEPRTENAPTVISTFAGCGGSSLGYSMAGYRELLAVEWDNNAVETFKLNFPDVPVYHGDIAKLTTEQVFQLTGLEPGQLDVFDGSPPCQGFSTAGKRILEDSRNQLFREYVRLLRGLQPKVFVMENVSGMVKGKMKLIFAEIMRELKASGYKVSARLMNAMYFNVPQSRERMIFIGVRNDLGIEPSYPKAQRKPFTVHEAFHNCPEWQVEFPDYSTALGKCCKGMIQGQSADEFYKPNWGFQLIRLHPFRVAPTISRGGGATGFIHPFESRKVSGAELRRLASFPDGFVFSGKRQNTQDRIGNSVPPLFMKAIAEHIRANILSS